MLDLLLVLTACAAALYLLSPTRVRNRFWRATVTPLASIIGSGFLVIVPVLGHSVGVWAPLAMAGISALAIWIGRAIRYVIAHAEAELNATGERRTPPWMVRFDRTSDFALALAYVVSVTFYLRLLAAFALHGFGVHAARPADVLTTVLLVAIGTLGYLRGLRFLEFLETYAVSIKLSVIAALIVGWAIYDAGALGTFSVAAIEHPPLTFWHTARVLAGALLVVQGFETSRYLGGEYDAPTRIRSMRLAQWIATGIYVGFVLLTVPSLPDLPHRLDETAIIDLAASIARSLPWLLILAALMSQFSAAIADTIGAGGLFAETVGRRLGASERHGYAIVSACAIALVWAVDIFEIIALASRAFAVYYALQALVASAAARQRNERLQALEFFILALVLAWIAAAAIPAG